MIRNIFVLMIFMFCVQGANAGFLDKVGAIIDTALAPTTTEVKSELITTVAAEHKLPAHWRTYWLDEPKFGTRIFLADTGKITAPVIMLVHGLGQNGLRDWLPIVPELEKHYRVIMIDLPGFANSPSPKAKLSPTHYADLLHVIKPYFSHKPIGVVGHSMGAAVTLRYAQRYPADINQIALVDAAGILQRTAFVKHSATDRIPVNPDFVPHALLTYAVGLQDFSNNLIEKMLRLPDPTSILGKSEIAWGTTLQSYPNKNSHFTSNQTSLTIKNSVVMMTGNTIDGLVNLDQARIDFAGVKLTKDTPFKINTRSRLVLSVSRAGDKRYLHSDLQLENTVY